MDCAAIRSASSRGWAGWPSPLLISLLDYLFRCAFHRPEARRAARAAWLHRASGRTLRFFQIKAQAAGPVPARGLLISNHLSYLDILVLSSLTPAVFVSKHDVKFWPVFGQFAVLGGTVFVDRARRFQVGRVNDEITSRVEPRRAGGLVPGRDQLERADAPAVQIIPAGTGHRPGVAAGHRLDSLRN